MCDHDSRLSSGLRQSHNWGSEKKKCVHLNNACLFVRSKDEQSINALLTFKLMRGIGIQEFHVRHNDIPWVVEYFSHSGILYIYALLLL